LCGHVFVHRVLQCKMDSACFKEAVLDSLAWGESLNLLLAGSGILERNAEEILCEDLLPTEEKHDSHIVAESGLLHKSAAPEWRSRGRYQSGF